MIEKNENGEPKIQTQVTNFASNVSRLGAYFIDVTVALIAGILLGSIIGGVNSGSTFFLMVNALYFTYFHYKLGQTPGMKILGIKISYENGNLMDGMTAFLRFMTFSALSILTLGINILLPLFSSKRQSLQDMIFKTVYSVEDINKSKRSIFVVAGYFFAITIITAVLIIEFGLLTL